MFPQLSQRCLERDKAVSELVCECLPESHVLSAFVLQGVKSVITHIPQCVQNTDLYIPSQTGQC